MADYQRMYHNLIEQSNAEIAALKKDAQIDIQRINIQRDENGELKTEIAKLQSALLEAMEWNWLDDHAPERFNINNLPELEQDDG